MRDIIIIDGKASSDFGVYLTDAGAYDAPRRRVSTISIPGRSGDLVYDEDESYDNIEVRYPAIIHENYDVNFAALKAYLLSRAGYVKIEDSFHPDEYRLGIYSEAIQPKVTTGYKMGGFEILFNCKPQRFLRDGERMRTITAASATLRNPTRFRAKPLIRAYGTGTFAIGNIQIQITSANQYTDIDCDMQEAYKGTANCNANIKLTNGIFPVIEAGTNAITKTGISRLEIYPRWWTL